MFASSVQPRHHDHGYGQKASCNTNLRQDEEHRCFPSFSIFRVKPLALFSVSPFLHSQAPNVHETITSNTHIYCSRCRPNKRHKIQLAKQHYISKTKGGSKPPFSVGLQHIEWNNSVASQRVALTQRCFYVHRDPSLR